MVIGCLVEVVLGNFLERLNFRVRVSAKLSSNHFPILAAELQLGLPPFLLLAGESTDIVGSNMRVLARLASCRLVIAREALIVRLNH